MTLEANLATSFQQFVIYFATAEDESVDVLIASLQPKRHSNLTSCLVKFCISHWNHPPSATDQFVVEGFRDHRQKLSVCSTVGVVRMFQRACTRNEAQIQPFDTRNTTNRRQTLPCRTRPWRGAAKLLSKAQREAFYILGRPAHTNISARIHAMCNRGQHESHPANIRAQQSGRSWVRT